MVCGCISFKNRVLSVLVEPQRKAYKAHPRKHEWKLALWCCCLVLVINQSSWAAPDVVRGSPCRQSLCSVHVVITSQPPSLSGALRLPPGPLCSGVSSATYVSTPLPSVPVSQAHAHSGSWRERHYSGGEKLITFLWGRMGSPPSRVSWLSWRALSEYCILTFTCTAPECVWPKCCHFTEPNSTFLPTLPGGPGPREPLFLVGMLCTLRYGCVERRMGVTTGPSWLGDAYLLFWLLEKDNL